MQAAAVLEDWLWVLEPQNTLPAMTSLPTRYCSGAAAAAKSPSTRSGRTIAPSNQSSPYDGAGPTKPSSLQFQLTMQLSVAHPIMLTTIRCLKLRMIFKERCRTHSKMPVLANHPGTPAMVRHSFTPFATQLISCPVSFEFISAKHALFMMRLHAKRNVSSTADASDSAPHTSVQLALTSRCRVSCTCKPVQTS